MTKTQYRNWLNGTAAEDCSLVSSLYIKMIGQSGQTLTDSGQICSFMSSASQSDIDNLEEIIFSGVNEDEWSATDEYQDGEIIRTANVNDVPTKIKRPQGT